MGTGTAHNSQWRLAIAGAAGAACICVYVYARRSRRWSRSRSRYPLASRLSDDLEVPEEYKDPISLAVMEDPVVLCATGQIYDYQSLKQWFMTGSLLCPKTNLELTDAQVTRLPWLKASITQWKQQQGLTDDHDSTVNDTLKSIHPELPTWIEDLKADTGERRVHAARNVNDLLCGWKTEVGVCEVCLERKHMVQDAVLDHMIWLVRYGSSYLQGVAASTLAHCSSEEEICFLVATALIPIIALLNSPNKYAKQAASRVLNNLVRSGAKARQIMRDAGAVQSLLNILTIPRCSYGYSRSPAAAALAVLMEDPDSREHVRKQGLAVLKEVLDSSCRYEVRDAASAIVALDLSQEELEGLALDPLHLLKLQWCSESWLLQQVDQPDQGYSPEELESFVDQQTVLRALAAGARLVMDQEEAEDNGEDRQDGNAEA